MTEKDFDAIYYQLDVLQTKCTHQIRRLRDLDLLPEDYAKKREYLRELFNGITLALAAAKRYERMYGGDSKVTGLVDVVRDLMQGKDGGKADGLHIGLYYIQKLVKE